MTRPGVEIPINQEGTFAIAEALCARGAQALILGAKVHALMDGRFNVAFEDVEAVAPAALRHRILLNFDGLAEGVRQDGIVRDLLGSLPRLDH